MSASRLDAVYRSMLLTKFFTKGWGKPENLRRLFEFRKVVSNRDECFKLVERDYPVTITKEQNLTDCKLVEGYFLTPLERYLPGIVPEIAQKAHFQALLPVHWPEPGCKPVCLHLAGTGDHFFWRRRNLMVKPLLKEAAIGGIILENPFYGLRKPTDQILANHPWKESVFFSEDLWSTKSDVVTGAILYMFTDCRLPGAPILHISYVLLRSSLHNVSDIFVMGGCLILESLVLFHWCERNGLGPLGVTGLSMGGHMASLAATNWPKPMVLVPCLSWSTASAVFLQGVMSHSINWDLLEDQYLSDGVYREKLSKMVTIVDEAFLAGKKFARTYSEKIDTDTQTDAQKEGTQENLVNNLKNDSNKNVDITYKESNNLNFKNGINNIQNQNTTELSDAEVPIKVTHTESLSEELRKMQGENKISKALCDKLTSNTTFELDAQDISEINKLNKNELKALLLKYRVDDHVKSIAIKSLTEHLEDTKSNSNKDLINTEKLSEKSLNMHIHNSVNGTKTENNEKVYNTSKHSDETEYKECKPEKKLWNVSEFTSDLWTSLPFLKSSGKKIDIGKIHWRDREALQFMRGIMDECTHLSNFTVPYDTSLIIAVCAKHDAYVPREDVGRLEEIWPGAEVRYVDAGHVSAYILHQSVFRACIKEAFDRSKKKWKDGKHIE